MQSEIDFPFPVKEVERLDSRRWILKYLPKGGVGAEIGVFRGHFSELICQIVQPKDLYLVDPWTLIGDHFSWGNNYTNDRSLPTEVAKNETIERMHRYPKVKSVLVEDYSYNFLKTCNTSFDWVYLDASHAFEETLKELNLIDTVLGEGGMILGDDWAVSPTHRLHGVMRAVNEFVKTNNYQFIVAGTGRQWCVRRTPKY